MRIESGWTSIGDPARRGGDRARMRRHRRARPSTASPTPWQMGMQDMVTELGASVARVPHLARLADHARSRCSSLGAPRRRSSVKFNEQANPVPSRTTHNTLLEVAWTIVPVLILVAIAIPSFRILREQLVIPAARRRREGDRLRLVLGLRVSRPTRAAASSSTAQHGPRRRTCKPRPAAAARRRQRDGRAGEQGRAPAGHRRRRAAHLRRAVLRRSRSTRCPGRLNETWFKADREGVYYGQCSELCGNGHPYMPIAIRVVSEERYARLARRGEAEVRHRTGDAAGEPRSSPPRR